MSDAPIYWIAIDGDPTREELKEWAEDCEHIADMLDGHFVVTAEKVEPMDIEEIKEELE